ncbi:LysR family transcriptional activator of dmlA [Vogesella perlucida]|nr:LysR family transcriptional activator of dmlA [Vogesella perlucida]
MKTMPLPDDVLVFEAIARLGSLTAAAEALGCTRSLVSLRLKALEKQLGAVLVLRTTRRLALTEAGQQLLPHARAMREALERMQHAVDSAQCAVEGPLALSTSVSMAPMLAPLLAELGRQQPGLQLRLDVTNRVQDPIADVLDFCLRARRVHDDSLVARPAGWVEEGLYASPAFLQQQGWPQHPDELLRFGLLSHDDGEQLTLVRGDDTWVLQPGAARIRSSAFIACLSMCVAGYGISVLPHYMAAPACRRGELQRVLPDWRGERWPVFLVYPYRQPMPRKYTVLIDFLLPRIAAALADQA